MYEQIYLTKVRQVGTSMGVVIPKEIIEAYGFERGEQIVFIIKDERYLGMRKLTAKEIDRLRDWPGEIIM